MVMNDRLPTWLGTAAIGSLVLLPLVGLAMAIVDRQPDAFTGEVSSIDDLISGAGVWVLLARSIALAVSVAIASVLCGG